MDINLYILWQESKLEVRWENKSENLFQNIKF